MMVHKLMASSHAPHATRINITMKLRNYAQPFLTVKEPSIRCLHLKSASMASTQTTQVLQQVINLTASRVTMAPFVQAHRHLRQAPHAPTATGVQPSMKTLPSWASTLVQQALSQRQEPDMLIKMTLARSAMLASTAMAQIVRRLRALQATSVQLVPNGLLNSHVCQEPKTI